MEENSTEVLVAFLPNKKDFAILQDQRWYRIPVASKPKRWPPKYLAFYQPKAFGDDAFKIRYFGLVKNIDIVTRREIFPNEIESEKSQKQYYRLWLESLQEREQSIPSRLPRKIVFVPTTWEKFMLAEQINDLFDDSPLEDLLWRELKKLNISAERQWEVRTTTFNYQLDFAFFCHDGNLDVETDGDTWHLRRDRVEHDNRRNNDLESLGWHVLRFNTKAISEKRGQYCIPRIQETINRLGGLSDDGLVSRKFYPKADGVQQLSLFESKADYIVDEDELDFD
jgi:very-short-patch-repair endonuclease